MRKVAFKSLSFIPASHEVKEDPGVLKKVLFKKSDFSQNTRVQMINWARLAVGKNFRAHFHQDMDEVFIILSGKVKIKIDKEQEILKKGDGVFIPAKSVHEMVNISNEEVNYIVVGLSQGKGGKTIKVDR